MKKQLRVTPTEYRGVRFRSKSEAIFARAMDLAGFKDWSYESTVIDGYTPDFFVDVAVRSWGYDLYYLVEYKPSLPTKTYMEKLMRIELPESLGIDGFYVVYGSPYAPEKPSGVWPVRNSDGRIVNKTAFVLSVCDPVMNKWMEAKEYRFDLAHEEENTNKAVEILESGRDEGSVAGLIAENWSLNGVANLVQSNAALVSIVENKINLSVDPSAKKLLTTRVMDDIEDEYKRIIPWVEEVIFPT